MYVIRQYTRNKRVIADEKYLNNLKLEQLRREVIQVWDTIKNGNKEIPIPIMIRTANGLKPQKDLVQNLRSTDIFNFGISSYSKHTDKDRGYKAVAAKEEVIMIHESIETGSTNQHATSVIQKFITEMYKGDTMLKIVPVNENTFILPVWLRRFLVQNYILIFVE